LLKESQRQELPLWSFTVYNFEMVEAVLSAAEAMDSPVVLLVSEKAAQSALGRQLMEMLVGQAAKSSAQCCLELDHAHDLAVIHAALEIGMNAVMADGARLSYPGNVKFVKAVIEVARTYGAEVEAELGLIAGAEDSLQNGSDGSLTDVVEAREFVIDTGLDCLAVSVGNVHGHYEGTPNLDWTRLQEIRKAVEVPIALHGVSGLNDKDIRQAVIAGVTKFNVNTELREIYFREVGLLLEGHLNTLDVLGVTLGISERIRTAVVSKLQIMRKSPESTFTNGGG
jgi:tagatose 1,6-diphosphate aldolase GatY/KbaY